MIGIYSYVDIKTMEVIYVGQSRRVYERHREHFHGQQPIDKKLRDDPIRYQLRIECECSTEELNDKEKKYIALYNPEYNYTSGGDYNYTTMCGSRKYDLWDTSKIHYVSHVNQNRNRPFRLYYKGQYVNLGYFEDWISAEVVWDLINEEFEGGNMKLSKSAVNSFLKCRREFQYMYIDKIQQQPNEFMQLGTDVHNIAETFIQDFDIDGDFYEQLVDIYESSGSEFPLNTHLFNLARFYDEVFHDENETYTVFSAEEYLHNKDIDFSGLCDLILEDEFGDLIIIDYKTSKSKPIKNYRLELTYYKLLVESEFPNKKVISAGIVFTKDGGMKFVNFCESQSKGSFVTKADEEAAIELLQFIREEIEEENFYPERQFLCKYCTYKDRCEREGGF